MPAWRSFDDGSTLAARLHNLRTGGGGGGGGGLGGFGGVGSSSISGGARSVTASTTFRKRSQFTDDFLARLDRIDTLGGLDAEGDHVGHSGCVNALAWSPSGDKLATGSDDQNIILWRFGTRHLHPSATRTSREDRGEDRHFPELDMGMSDVIQTGHRGNIFSVKWAPNSSDSRLFSCAGDSTVRVFDLNRASSSSFCDEHTNAGREYRLWPRDNGVCTRVLRCHKSRAKRISTENSPDVFLTCAEDGEVRQMDLRLPHTCSPSQGYGHGCPRPLVAYNMELYSLSVSKMEPWLFCVAGTSAQAYLHDRRMIPRLLSAEWGATIDSESVARTQCVRRFARPPYEYSAAKEEAEEEEEDEEGEGGPTLHREGADGEARVEARRRRQRKWERAHITAVKISESNGRDLLASYSGDAVYKFDLKGEPNVIHGRDADASIDGKGKGTMRSSKRKKASHSPPRRSNGWEFASLAKRKLSRGVDVKRLQRRATAILFPRPAQLSSARFDAALLELDELEKATEQSLENGGGGVADGAVARLCRTLLVLHSSRRSQEDDDEQGPGQVQGDVVDVEHAKLVLGQAREHVLLRDEFVPLLDELEEAVNWNATGQIEKLEATLWETAQEIVMRAWGEDSFTGPERIQVVDEERSHLEKLAAEESEASVSGEEEVLGKDTLEEDTHDEEAEERGQVDMPMARFLRDDVLQRTQAAQAMDEDEEDGGEDGEEGEEMSIQEDEDSELDSEAYDISIEKASDDDDDGGDLDESVGGKSPIVYPVARYAGHANNETVKDCGFLGPNDEHVWSGSDSGHFFVWDNIDERLKALFKGDDCVTNVVQPHPLLPVLAASGIDDTVKLFGPVGPGSRKLADRLKDREDIIRKNRKQRRGGTGISSRAIMQLFASHIMREQGGEGGATRVVNADGEEEECVVM